MLRGLQRNLMKRGEADVHLRTESTESTFNASNFSRLAAKSPAALVGRISRPPTREPEIGQNPTDPLLRLLAPLLAGKPTFAGL